LLKKAIYIEIVLPFNMDYLQHTQFIHGSVIAGIADTACGYACISLAKANEEMLTLEYKINFLKPARGNYFTAKAKVLKNGARVKVSICEVTNEKSEIVALMTASIMVLEIKVTPIA
jgi:uncharacterized protein (TIGR00369 family)